MKVKRIGRPVTPRSTEDPVGAKRSVNASYKQIDKKMKRIAKEVIALLESVPRKSVTVNALKNASRRYEYDVNANWLQQASFFIQQLIYGELLDSQTGNFTERWWMNLYLGQQYARGTQQAIQSSHNLATTVAVGVETSQLVRGVDYESILLTPGYLTRVGLVKGRVFEEMKGLSDDMRSSLSSSLARGMANGLGVREIKADIMKNVFGPNYKEGKNGGDKYRAERIARTEINNAYRTAYWGESDELNETVWKDSGFVTRLLWFSALSATTRLWHARRHGRVYSSTECRDFYSKDGNAIFCLCSQVEVLVDKKTGRVVNQEFVDMVAKDRPKYLDKAA